MQDEACVSSALPLFLSVLQNASGDPAVSSTVNPLTTKRSKVKTEAEGPLPISPTCQVRKMSASSIHYHYFLIFITLPTDTVPNLDLITY